MEILGKITKNLHSLCMCVLHSWLQHDISFQRKRNAIKKSQTLKILFALCLQSGSVFAISPNKEKERAKNVSYFFMITWSEYFFFEITRFSFCVVAFLLSHSPKLQTLWTFNMRPSRIMATWIACKVQKNFTAKNYTHELKQVQLLPIESVLKVEVIYVQNRW